MAASRLACVRFVGLVPAERFGDVAVVGEASASTLAPARRPANSSDVALCSSWTRARVYQVGPGRARSCDLSTDLGSRSSPAWRVSTKEPAALGSRVICDI